jgi:hypothetical protein
MSVVAACTGARQVRFQPCTPLPASTPQTAQRARFLKRSFASHVTLSLDSATCTNRFTPPPPLISFATTPEVFAAAAFKGSRKRSSQTFWLKSPRTDRPRVKTVLQKSWIMDHICSKSTSICSKLMSFLVESGSCHAPLSITATELSNTPPAFDS